MESKRNLSGKLSLNKETVTTLADESMKIVQGGLNEGSRQCDTVYGCDDSSKSLCSNMCSVFTCVTCYVCQTDNC